MDKKSLNAYLRIIYELEESEKNIAVKSISTSLKIKPASVSEMLNKLSKEGYIVHAPYKKIILTDKGKKEGQLIARRYRLLQDFLFRILKINESKINEQAAQMESSLSTEAEIELCRFLDRPMLDPLNNKPISHCEQKLTCAKCLCKK
ncbi:MAG: metal-dependent transcriptional regulator [Candidatus Micrarchaeota archaeon]